MPLVRSPLTGEPNAKVGRYLSWVRTVGLVLVVSLVMAVSAPAPARASTAELVQQLDGLLSSFPGGAGIWVRMQADYDTWHAERNVDVSKIPTLKAA